MPIPADFRGAPNSAVSFCPVDKCDWHLDVTPPTLPDGTLADVFGQGVMAAVAYTQHCQRVEDDIRRHLDGHSVLEFVTTIMRLRGELAEARGGKVAS